MTRSDDHLERLINRKLDGELTQDESLELDKCLIRDPATRQSLEESERIDRLTAALLEEVCAVQDEVPGSDDESPAALRVSSRRARRTDRQALTHRCCRERSDPGIGDRRQYLRQKSDRRRSPDEPHRSVYDCAPAAGRGFPNAKAAAK